MSKKSSGPSAGLVVALVGVGGVALAGLARLFAARKSEVSGLRDLPAHYPFYPRVLPSYQVPRKVHRDAQIIQEQEVNAAGKVILSEEIQPVQAERYLPNFSTLKRRRLPENPFEFGMGRMGTDRPRRTYSPGFEEVNATYENVDGVNMRRLSPSSPEEFASVGEMGTALDDEGEAADAEERIRRVSRQYEITARDESDDPDVDWKDADEVEPESATKESEPVEDEFEGDAAALPAPAVQPRPGREAKRGKRRTSEVANMAEFGEYAGDVDEFEKLEDDLMEGTA